MENFNILSTRLNGDLRGKNFQYQKGGHSLLFKTLILLLIFTTIALSTGIAVISSTIATSAYLPYNERFYNFYFSLLCVVVCLFFLYLLAQDRFSLLIDFSIAFFVVICISVGGKQEEYPNIIDYIYLTAVVLFTAQIGAYLMSFMLLLISISGGIYSEKIALFFTVITAEFLNKINVGNFNIPPRPILKIWMEVVIFLATLAIIITAVIIAHRAKKGSDKFTWLWKQAVFWSAIGGTSFYGVDLTDASFYCAQLPQTDFRKATLTRTNFEGVTGLEYSRLQGTILEQPKVRHLLTTKIGRNEDYTAANFNGANIKGADLTAANLIGIQALEADFSGAILTGACIQDWKINSKTNLDRVICDYTFLRKNQQERRPISGNFEPGEFTKLFQESLDTVDLIFREGVDWKAFAYSFQNAQVINEDTPLAIQSIENKGDGVVVIKVHAPPNADKDKIHGDFWQGYEFAQKALKEQYEARLEDKDKHINQLFSLLQESQEKLGEIPKYDLRGAQFTGGFAETVQGNQTGGNQYN